MLECAAYMTDLARLQLERIAESSDCPVAADIVAADTLDQAISALDSVKRLLGANFSATTSQNFQRQDDPSESSRGKE